MARPVIDTGRAYFFLKIPYSLAQVMYDLLNDTYRPMLLLSDSRWYKMLSESVIYM